MNLVRLIAFRQGRLVQTTFTFELIDPKNSSEETLRRLQVPVTFARVINHTEPSASCCTSGSGKIPASSRYVSIKGG
jgi:hypothetical protein